MGTGASVTEKAHTAAIFPEGTAPYKEFEISKNWRRSPQIIDNLLYLRALGIMEV